MTVTDPAPGGARARTVLPPGFTAEAFDLACEDLRAAVGERAVLVDPGDAAWPYRDPFAVDGPDRVASAAVLPESVEQVRRVLAVARDHGLPLAPISAGRNLGYGGAAPHLPGAVVLDLQRMNRVLEVDTRLGYAVVEPGVTFLDLHDHLAASGAPFRADVPDLGWGSVIGNTLERGIGYTPYGDHFGAACGMEVVLADGDVVRTGMGALPGGRTWHTYPYGYGPVHEGLFTQSNFGVVTRMGVWLLPEPPAYRSYMITLPREEDVAPFLDALRPLRLSGAVRNVPTLRSLLLDAAASGPRSRWWSGPGPVPPRVQREIMAELGSGMWNFYGAMYGEDAADLDRQWTRLRDVLGVVPGAGFHLSGEHPSPVLATRDKIMAGRANLETAAVLGWVDHCGHIDFAPSLPLLGDEVLAQCEVERDLAHAAGKDFTGILVCGVREVHHINLIMFDTLDDDDRARTRDLLSRLIARAAADGIGVFRANPTIMDEVAATYRFGDGALMRLNERLKDALDPGGVLAPGKQGIWPRRMRAPRP